MTNIKVCQDVMQNGFAFVRESVYQPDTESINYEIKRSGSKRGCFILDLFSASAVLAVYEAMNEQNKTKCLRIPLMKLVNFSFKYVK